VLQRTPSRGIWEWARAGTGRLNIIGRIPHPEWKGPAVVKKPGAAINGETIHESHDDFSIPSTTATAPDGAEQQHETAAAKVEGLGIENIISPSFAQTKMSSDELVATASSTGTPESRVRDEPWTNGDNSTPSAASKDSPPSTPDTPTPQQRKKDPSSDTRDASEVAQSPTPQKRRDDVPSESDNAPTPRKKSVALESPSTKNTPTSDEAPSSNTSSQKKTSRKNSPSPHHVPTYKIALASNLLSPARTDST